MGGFLALVLATASSSAWAQDQEVLARAVRSIAEIEQQSQRIVPRAKKDRLGPSPAERIAAGDMLLRSKDYERAIHTFSQVVELYHQGKVPAASHADALYLLAESYFRAGQYLSARRHFRTVVDGGARSSFGAYVGRALGRLVDVALRTDDLESLDYVFERLATLPSGDATGSLQYARAKALFARGDLAAAQAAIGNVPGGSDYEHQAQYLLGVVLTKTAAPAEALSEREAQYVSGERRTDERVDGTRFAGALDQFRKLTRMAAESPAHRHVIDLGWMAIGRIHYETESYLEAAEAYSHIDRGSPEFSTVLYELAWVYVRLGDLQRAQRALEVLSIAQPDSTDVADGMLLRADLMLRAGEHDKARALYERALARYEPIGTQVDVFLGSTTDPAVYYDKLTAEDFGAGELPPIVMDWARQEAEDEGVFRLIDDVTRSRNLIRQSRDMAVKLSSVLGSPARAKAFPKLQSTLEQTIALQNRLSMVRHALAQEMDKVAGTPSGELIGVRQQRRALMQRVSYMPLSDGDFLRRESAGESQWNAVSQRMQQLMVEIDRLRAIVNGLKRVLADADGQRVSRDPAARDRFRQEIAANERDLARYQELLQEYRVALEAGRAQVGFGDSRYVEDDQVRARFQWLFAREIGLAASGLDSKSVSYAAQTMPLLRRADEVQAQLDAARAMHERMALENARELMAFVRREAANVEAYARALDELDQQARLLVGEVAMENFGRVRERLKSIVLRADVGLVQQAWEAREERRLRVRELQREKNREEQKLNDELREILDDAEDDL
jgi:tetratricopeptide (TPR) repeat protein